MLYTTMQGRGSDVSITKLLDTTYMTLDHLMTPNLGTNADQTLVWRWDSDAFRFRLPDRDPDGDGTNINMLIGMPGQYYDYESQLYYNWNRYYDRRSGRYVTSDPIGLGGGLNTYGYVYQNPLMYSDMTGLDVKICFYDTVANHVGITENPKGVTRGFYPAGNPISGPGTIKPDTKTPPDSCKVLDADKKEDNCIKKCINDRANNPGKYKLLTRQCTSFARDCLRICGIYDGDYDGPLPREFYNEVK